MRKDQKKEKETTISPPTKNKTLGKQQDLTNHFPAIVYNYTTPVSSWFRVQPIADDEIGSAGVKPVR